MDKQVEKIRDAVSKIPGSKPIEDDGELREAIEQIDASLESLEKHPQSEKIRDALAEVAEKIDPEKEPDEENLASRVLHLLTDELNHYEDEHPGTTLLVGRLANALAVFGL